MAKFTPAPWKKAGQYIVDTDHKNIIASVENDANAQLIAAAPEMYQKLNEFVSELEDFLTVYDSSVFNDEFFDLVNMTKDLLARIDGEAEHE